MSVKYKRRAPAKLIVMGVLFVVMALAATAGIVAVLALTSRTITSNVNITFEAVDIDGEVEAAYKVGDSGAWTSMNGSAPYRFTADDENGNKEMSPADIELTSQNRYVEFRYIFRNYGHVDYTAILSLNEVDENNNMKLEYKYNNKTYTPTGYGLVIEGTNSPVAGKVQTNEDGEEYVEMTYYVKASVKQLTRDANYQSDFFWLLENYEAQPGEETIRLATSEYTDNGDGTFSASYSGANISVASMMTDSSTPSIENIWNVPSRFGSASVTAVKPGDELPANTKVVLGDNVTTIEEGTFSYYDEDWNLCCREGLVEVVLGKGIKEIPQYCFEGSPNLKKVEIPEGVKKIEWSAFSGCTSLKEITIPSTVEYLGDSAFAYCTGVEVLNYNAANVTSEITMPFGNLGENANYTVVNIDCINIPIELFYGCEYIDEVNLSNNVKRIGDSAFFSCYSLTSIVIPANVINIEESVFSGCTGLKIIEVDENNTVYASEGNCLLNKAKTELIQGCKTSVIPSSVTSIGDYAFDWCTDLTSIVIPDSVTSIGNRAFYSCNGLTSIIIPDNVTSIGNDAFAWCSNLTSIVIPSSVKSIGGAAFSSSSLTSVEFKNTTGWFVASSADATSGTNLSSTDLANTSTAATYLKSTYCSYNKYWKRG